MSNVTLRRLREESKKSRSEVATALNVTPNALTNYEQGTRRISLEQVLILAEIYNVGTDEVIEAQINSCRCAQEGNRH